MKTDIQKVGSCRIKFSVEAPVEVIDPIYKAVPKEYVAQAKLPGFRPGKAPLDQVKKLYGKAIQDTINQRVTATLYKAHEEAKIDVEALVDVEGLRSGVGQGASATFILDVAPEFKLPDLKKWQVKKMDNSVSETEIQERMASIRRMAASFREATADDIATADDLLAISFTSDIAPDSVSSAAKHYIADDEYWVQLREDAFIPGLKDVLLGKKVGDKVVLKATYPKDFKVEELKGKKVTYDITVKSMRKLEPADDAAVIARFQVKSLDELTERAIESLKASKTYEEEQRALNALCEQIDKSLKFDLPERPLDSRIYDELMADPAKPLETFANDVEALKKSEAYKQASARAVAALRRSYALAALAKERNIKLTNEEVGVAINSLANSAGLQPQELTKRLIRNERMSGFLAHTLETKVLRELLKECAVL